MLGGRAPPRSPAGYWPRRLFIFDEHGQDRGPKGCALDAGPWAGRLLAIFVCEAAADVGVRDPGVVVEIQVEEPGVLAVAPIAAVLSLCPWKWCAPTSSPLLCPRSLIQRRSCGRPR